MGTSCFRAKVHKPQKLVPQVLLLWVKSFPSPLHRLSANVAREVCSYLKSLTFTVYIEGNRVLAYDYTSEQWKTLFPLSPEIPAYRKFTVSTFVGTEKLFVWCLVEGREPAAFLLEKEGTVKLPDPLCPMSHPGVIYYPQNNCVYMLGGGDLRGNLWPLYLDAESRFPSNSGHSFSLLHHRWTKTADMLTARSHFTPFIYNSRIWLVGGKRTSAVETYDPSMDTFTLIPEIVLPERTACLSLIENGELLVISELWVTRWDLRTSTLISQREKKFNDPESECDLRTWNGKLYYVRDEVSVSFDLQTFEVKLARLKKS